MKFILRSAYYTTIQSETRSGKFCQICKETPSFSKYDNPSFHAEKFLHVLQKPNAKGLDRWPMCLGSFKSLLLHEEVVEQLNRKVEGYKFHKVQKISGNVLESLGKPPSYYKVEPLGYMELLPRYEEFDLTSCICGPKLTQRGFGEFKFPFQFDHNLSDDRDFFRIKYFEFWVCVSKRVIDIIVKNNWMNDFQIGDRALPGIKIKDFGENWFEDTNEKLKTLFSNSVVFE